MAVSSIACTALSVDQNTSNLDSNFIGIIKACLTYHKLGILQVSKLFVFFAIGHHCHNIIYL